MNAQKGALHFLADWYPAAIRRPLHLHNFRGMLVPAEQLSGAFSVYPLGWILHVVAGNNDPYEVFRTAQRPDRRFSNWWVSKSGRVVQYVPAWAVSWAMGEGNPRYWSVETEGFPSERLTGAQLDALAALHVWLQVQDAVAVRPGDRGIGTHGMGGAAWGNHPGCPGPIRAGQRAEILRRAVALRSHHQEDDMPTAKEVAQALLDLPAPGGGVGSDEKPLTVGWMLRRTYDAAMRADAGVHDLADDDEQGKA